MAEATVLMGPTSQIGRHSPPHLYSLHCHRAHDIHLCATEQSLTFAIFVADVGSGHSNGADGPGKPDGQAQPSGTNAGAVQPPPGSGRRLLEGQEFPVQDEAIETVAEDVQKLVDSENEANAGRRLLQEALNGPRGVVGEVQTLEDVANANVVDQAADDGLGMH